MLEITPINVSRGGNINFYLQTTDVPLTFSTLNRILETVFLMARYIHLVLNIKCDFPTTISVSEKAFRITSKCLVLQKYLFKIIAPQ